MGAEKVFLVIAIAFIAILLVFLIYGLLKGTIDCCCGTWSGTNSMGKRNTTEATYIYINETNVQITHHLGPQERSSQYNTQDNTNADGGAFSSQSDSDFDLPMCDPTQAYPMPAPEHSTHHTYHLESEGQSSQYTFHNNTQGNTSGNTHANSTTFRLQRDYSLDLPMCDPIQAYPMPAPEHSRPSSLAAHSASASEHTSRRLRESPPIPNAPWFDRVTEDLPPSYDEAVSKTKAGNYKL